MPKRLVSVFWCDAQSDVPSTGGLGRNLRSKTQWFTGFCNSHQVSHFATFFIDARAKISVAESLIDSSIITARGSSSRLVITPSKQHKYSLTPSGAVGSVGTLYYLCRTRVHAKRWRTNHPQATWMTHSQFLLLRVTTMILPQVHLRKPCYDFSFL